jgi:hypothetical protein
MLVKHEEEIIKIEKKEEDLEYNVSLSYYADIPAGVVCELPGLLRALLVEFSS